MGAASDRHISIPERKKNGHALSPGPSRPMGSPESPKISLVSTAQKAPAWGRSLFHPDSIFKGLMLVAALAVLAVVGVALSELLHRSVLAWQKFGFDFFATSAWDPVAGEFGALPFIFGTLVSSILAL